MNVLPSDKVYSKHSKAYSGHAPEELTPSELVEVLLTQDGRGRGFKRRALVLLFRKVRRREVTK